VTDRPLILSVFPGIDLLGRAFEEEWPEACLVRGPDLIFGGDIRAFHPPGGKFDGVIGGPPCQFFSIMKRLNPAAGEKHGNLIPEFERVVFEAGPTWFLMEEVPGAPVPVVAGYVVRDQLVKDVWVGGETSRLRRFSFGTRDGRALQLEWLALHRPDPMPATLAGGGGRSVPVRIGGSGKRKKTIEGRRHGPHTGPRAAIEDVMRSQGLPPDFLADAPFTKDGKVHAVGNGVPQAMGRAVARAVRNAVADAATEAA
jgi:DNA (cytosine-5)-methyltransferase 1